MQFEIILVVTQTADEKKIRKFINENIPELLAKWDTINTKIGNINDERRYLVHGIGQTNFFVDSIKAIIRKKVK